MLKNSNSTANNKNKHLIREGEIFFLLIKNIFSNYLRLSTILSVSLKLYNLNLTKIINTIKRFNPNPVGELFKKSTNQFDKENSNKTLSILRVFQTKHNLHLIQCN